MSDQYLWDCFYNNLSIGRTINMVEITYDTGSNYDNYQFTPGIYRARVHYSTFVLLG